MSSVRQILRTLKVGVEQLRIDDEFRLPIYQDPINEIDNPEIGMRVYVTGVGSLPEGVWRYTEGERWEDGSTRPRHNSSITQRTMPNGDTFIVHQFNMPANAEIVVWEAVFRNTQGNNNGLFLEIQDTDAGNTIYQYDAQSQAPEVDLGRPLARGGGAGNQIRIRGRNSAGTNKQASGFVNWSFERV